MTTTSPPLAQTDRTPTRAGRGGATTKRRILDAAQQVVLRDGVGHLTLEAAADQAGLSKGGVLYHFPTRDALVAAMVARIIEQFEDDIAAYLPAPGTPEHGRPGAFARAYVRATMAPSPEGEERLGAALLAAAAAEPELLVPAPGGRRRLAGPTGRRRARPDDGHRRADGVRRPVAVRPVRPGAPRGGPARRRRRRASSR